MDKLHMRAGLRLVDVARWNMVRTTRAQSVMEHSAAVAFIAARLATKVGLCPKTAAYWGLLHDIDESVTGDVPSHVKRAVKRAGVDMNTLGDTFDPVPEEYRPIIKMADKLEGLFWLSEYKTGSHTEWVLTDIISNYSRALEALPPDMRSAVNELAMELNEDIRPDFTFGAPEEKAPPQPFKQGLKLEVVK